MSPPRPKVQILFVSGQMVPNVTPLLDGAMRPESAILCATDAMSKAAENLRGFLERHGIRAEVFALGRAYEFEDLQDKMLELAARFDVPQEVAVNITGGTKLITIAGQTVFAGNGFPCFYVNPERDQALLLGCSPPKVVDLENRLNIEDYFEIHGYTVPSLRRKAGVKPGFRKLASSIFADPKLKVGELNYLAAKAEDAYSLLIKNDISEASWQVFRLFMDYGAIAYYDDKKVEFASEADRDFCKGFWLEDHVLLTLKQLAEDGAIQDYAASIEIESPSGTRNEIDAAFLLQNRLHLIECKTCNMKLHGNDAVYKIDTIKNDTGLFSVAILATFNKLPEHVARRARDQRIRVLEGQALKNLAEHLAKPTGQGGTHA